MTHFEQLSAALTGGVSLSAVEQRRIAYLNAQIPGYSEGKQYAFFREVVALPGVRAILILGVYHGRDIAYMRDNIVRNTRTERIRITGVDKFSDTPCADWPDHARGMKWLETGFGPAPSRKLARQRLCGDYGIGVELVESEDAEFLATTEKKFDVVYVDTSHDHETVSRQLRQVRAVCNEDALICGDDYSDAGTWGVKRAVTEAFTAHSVFAEWIWFSSLSLLKTRPGANEEVFS